VVKNVLLEGWCILGKVCPGAVCALVGLRSWLERVFRVDVLVSIIRYERRSRQDFADAPNLDASHFGISICEWKMREYGAILYLYLLHFQFSIAQLFDRSNVNARQLI